MAPHPTVAFDLDGTLVDTAPDLLDALNLVLREAALAPISADDARGLFGGGARVLIERGLAFHGMRVDDADIDKMQAHFLAYYEDHLADRSRPYPGAIETLDALRQRARLIVVTNKFERYSTKLLEALGLARHFSVVAGPDTFGVRKPDPGHLLRAVARAGGDPAATIMIGDSMTDVATARAAKVPVVVVSYGYSDVEAAALGADRVIDRLDEAPAAVNALLDEARAGGKPRP
ncbi:MAG: HAD family hydrolase [Xanthobacteraceae bacterium]